MPQINKIRIVNFCYNGGNRFIPDELYDLSSPETGEALNTLFNLNNGGGKTVLVQLMMQPVHPRAMAGGRRIEDYFARQGDHSFILLEWDLDESKDKLLIGIAIAASSSNAYDDDQRGNRIKYYTFKTTYDGYSQYNIAALDLSKNENGRFVPAHFDYIREKAKASKGKLEYYSSDDSVKWTEMLSEEYGIRRTEWETVIEALNKDEGGLNQYFDEARTSDKLIAKFFLPAIEHKFTGNASKGDSSLETMLIGYAKKITDKEDVILERNINKDLLSELTDINKLTEQLYTANDELNTSLSDAYGFKKALSQCIADMEEIIAGLAQEIEKQNNVIEQIKFEEKSKAYYDAKERYELASAAFIEISTLLEGCRSELNERKHDVDILRCADLYGQIRESEAKITEIKKLIEDKENNSEDAERIASLKYSAYVKAREVVQIKEKSAEEFKSEIDKKCKIISECEQSKNKAEKEYNEVKEKYTNIKAELGVAKENTDKRIKSLNIEIIRKLHGFYSEDELKTEKIQKIKYKEQIESDVREIQNCIEQTENRKNAIPAEKADIQIKQNAVSLDLEQIRLKANEYDDLYADIKKISEKYSLEDTSVFSGVLQNTVRKDKNNKEAELSDAKKKLEVIQEKLKAAESGSLHILPEIMRYIESTGLPYITGEKYICDLIEEGNLSSDKAEEILSKYPELAYSLLFNTDKELQCILSAGNVEWLPAVVPLYTMEQMNRVLADGFEASTFLAACDKLFFADKQGYFEKINEKSAGLEEKIKHLQEYLAQTKNDLDVTGKFNYDDNWRTECENQMSLLKQENDTFYARLSELDKESQKLGEILLLRKKEFKGKDDELRETDRWLESFAELEKMIFDEKTLEDKRQNVYKMLKNKEDDYKKASDELNKHNDVLSLIMKKQEENNSSIREMRDILSDVDTAKETEIIENEPKILYSQYKSLLANMKESLEGLENNLKSEQNKKHDAQTELAVYECDESEYKTVSYSPEALKKATAELKKTEAKRDTFQKDFDKKNGENGSAKEAFRQAQNLLGEYGGCPLPKDSIGDRFNERIKSAADEKKSLNKKHTETENEKSGLKELSYKINALLENFNAEIGANSVDLSEKPDEQWKQMAENLNNNKSYYNDTKNKLNEKIRNTVAYYKNKALDEIVEKLDYISAMLEDADIKGDKLFTVSESVEAMITSIEKINNKIETDLREIENDFNDVVNQCFLQGKKMYTDLRMIANSSKVHIYPGKPQTQMVKMDMPEENEISEEASRISVKNEIEQGANELKEMMKNGTEEKLIHKRAKVIVGNERLLHKYIRKETIQVKVYKIDLNSANSLYKKWEDTLTQSSGAEKFVVFFSVVLTLMNYTRSAAGLVNNKSAKSVLILDNPFGKITSAHLLIPMFDIAKHFNVQLICLSDINKSDVISCFDCVIKLVIKMQSLSDSEIMTHEGNEKIEHGYYKLTNRQLSLF